MNNLCATLQTSFDEDISLYIKEKWKRFLKDYFIFCTKATTDLNKFHDIINSLHESIKSTVEYDEKQLSFLDIVIIKEVINIITDLCHVYCKDIENC